MRTTTLLPLWTPARTMAILPEVREGRTLRACLEKNFFEVPGAGLENKYSYDGFVQVLLSTIGRV